MTDPVKMERWQRQFSACCGRVMTKAKALTGIEKAALEGVQLLDEIAEEYQREFGRHTND
jgi:hypothetical protein